MDNPYLPKQARIEAVVAETEDGSLKTFTLALMGEKDAEAFNYTPGQFAQLSIAGKGEIPIGIASSPTEKGVLKFTVKKAGVVTSALHWMTPGRIIGIRGPFGNGFPWKRLRGKTVVMIGGGFGFTTLRSAIVYMLAPENRCKFKDIHVIYGARNPGMMLYLDELEAWARRDDIRMHIVAQEADPQWPYHTGLAPVVARQVIPGGDTNTMAIVCGPPAMIKFTQPVLDDHNYCPDRIVLSLEMRMKCGIGMCGRCNVGGKFVCTDGPVFTMAALAELPKEY